MVEFLTGDVWDIATFFLAPMTFPASLRTRVVSPATRTTVTAVCRGLTVTAVGAVGLLNSTPVENTVLRCGPQGRVCIHVGNQGAPNTPQHWCPVPLRRPHSKIVVLRVGTSNTQPTKPVSHLVDEAQRHRVLAS